MQLHRGGCPAVTDGLDGFRESQILLRRVRGRTPALPPACWPPAPRSHQRNALSRRCGVVCFSGGISGSVAGFACCLARWTAPTNTRMPRPRTSRSSSICAVSARAFSLGGRPCAAVPGSVFLPAEWLPGCGASVVGGGVCGGGCGISGSGCGSWGGREPGRGHVCHHHRHDHQRHHGQAVRP